MVVRGIDPLAIDYPSDPSLRTTFDSPGNRKSLLEPLLNVWYGMKHDGKQGKNP